MAEHCARLEVEQPDLPAGKGVVYVKSRWFANKFSLSISDGFDAWICEASEEEVSRKAFSWDYTIAQYLTEAEDFLACQKVGCKYSFTSLGDAARKLSWTVAKEGLQLVAHWKVEKSPHPREITLEILDYLMKGSSRLTEELQRKKRSFDLMKAEAERAQAQSQKFRDEKIQFEVDIYKKFVAVLNSKKTKLRELRELALQSAPAEVNKGEKDLDYKTESEDELDDSGSEGANSDPKGKRPIERDADVDSLATEVLHSESPTADVSSRDPGQSVHDISSKHEVDQEPEKLQTFVTQTRTLDPAAEPVIDAATLLSGSTYTSAPRKRRHL